MSIQHKHNEKTHQLLDDHVRVKATTTFKAYLNGIEPIQFMRDTVHPRAFLRTEVEVYLKERAPRLIEVTDSMLKKAAAEAEARQKAQEAEDKKRDEALAKEQAKKKEADDKAAAEAEAKAKAEADEKAKKDAEEAEERQKADSSSKGADSKDGKGSKEADLPGITVLETMNKAAILAQAAAEKVPVQETMSKAQIRDAIMKARELV